MRLRRLEPVVRAALRGPCRSPEGSRLLVAVSGGADSVSLLLALHRVAPEFGLEIRAAHLDHGLRGAESDHDRRFVEDLCRALGIPLTSARWDARRRMKRRGLTGERGLRVLRRAFLEDAARRAGAVAIATAHTANDQLETMLLRLMRGTGLPGLGGMRPRAGRWIKPLLEATRRDVVSDLEAGGHAWREDSSNDDLRFARNRVRHLVVPAMVEALGRGPDPERALARLARRTAWTAAEARAAWRTVDATARRSMERSLTTVAEIAIPITDLRSSSAAVRRAMLRSAWRHLAGGSTGLTHRHLQSVEHLASTARIGACVRMPAGGWATREREFLRLGSGMTSNDRPSSGARSAPELPGNEVFQLDVPGEVSCGRHIIQGGWITGQAAEGRFTRKLRFEEFFAAEGLEGVLELRTARADETFVPFGERRRSRIGEFLRKQGVPVEFRSHPTVLADAKGILWVVGVRRSARAPVTHETRKVLRVLAESHD